MKKKLCFKCDLEVTINDYFIYALERPYLNLYFHKNCYREIKENMKLYLSQNLEKLYNYNIKSRKTGK